MIGPSSVQQLFSTISAYQNSYLKKTDLSFHYNYIIKKYFFIFVKVYSILHENQCQNWENVEIEKLKKNKKI